MKFCLNCGEELPEKAHFCPNCGAKIETASSESSPAVQSCIKNRQETPLDDLKESGYQTERRTNDQSRSQKKQCFYGPQGGCINYVAMDRRQLVNGSASFVSNWNNFYWLSKMVGVVLLVVAVVAAFFYAQRVGAGDRSADQAVKAILQKGGEAGRQVWQNCKWRYQKTW